ncbi:MAG: Lrp/AsnC family transcriptional regulator [Candidatus Bathyarchaeota archaeon]|nr:MAG: Lrp/AsnC family transcriptional regulator [Candidatus Bathyarchaeota archaeon]
MKLKGIDYKILASLMNNCKVSDRQLAKILGVSQPTITRRRTKLEKDFIQAYTAIPNWAKLGFEIVALTFIHGRSREIKLGERAKAVVKSKEWFSKEPNVVFAAAGSGMEHQGVIISVHKKYSTLADFDRRLRVEMSEYIGGTSTFIVDINPGVISKPFHLKYLTEVE